MHKAREKAVQALRKMSFNTKAELVTEVWQEQAVNQGSNPPKKQPRTIAIDPESAELHERVQKWVLESKLPSPTDKVAPKANAAANGEDQRSHTDDGGAENCETLYHPDFADWRTLTVKDSDQAAVESFEEQQHPSVDIVTALDDAHHSISRFVSESFGAIISEPFSSPPDE